MMKLRRGWALYLCVTVDLILAASYQQDAESSATSCRSSDGCTCALSTNTSIDISRAFDYPVKNIIDPDPQYSYEFSPCDPLPQCSNGSAAACQLFRNSSFSPVTLGLVSSVTWTVESATSFTVSYIGGDVTFDGFKRQAQFHFYLDASTASNSISFLGEKRNNLDKVINYHFRVILGNGHHDPPITGVVGLAIIASFLIVLLLYFALGSLYHYSVKKARGAQVIPHYTFWCDLPTLVKDGCCFVVSPFKLCLHCGTTYSRYHDSEAHQSLI